MMRHFPDLIRDARGTSVVELGILLPLFAAMLMGVVDLSRAYSTKLQMQQAAQRAVERVQRDNFKLDDSPVIQQEAADGAEVSLSNVTVDAWLECNGSKMGSYTDTCQNGQTMARYVTVEVKKDYEPFFSTKFIPGPKSGNSVTLTTEAGVRTQ